MYVYIDRQINKCIDLYVDIDLYADRYRYADLRIDIYYGYIYIHMYR